MIKTIVFVVILKLKLKGGLGKDTQKVWTLADGTFLRRTFLFPFFTKC